MSNENGFTPHDARFLDMKITSEFCAGELIDLVNLIARLKFELGKSFSRYRGWKKDKNFIMHLDRCFAIEDKLMKKLLVMDDLYVAKAEYDKTAD